MVSQCFYFSFLISFESFFFQKSKYARFSSPVSWTVMSPLQVVDRVGITFPRLQCLFKLMFWGFAEWHMPLLVIKCPSCFVPKVNDFEMTLGVRFVACLIDCSWSNFLKNHPHSVEWDGLPISLLSNSEWQENPFINLIYLYLSHD